MVMGRAFIELRDLNYPGSTYTLTYELASNHLTKFITRWSSVNASSHGKTSMMRHAKHTKSNPTTGGL
jgi:hypothetical protein